MWKNGLQLIALAIQGVRFKGWQAAMLAVWNLAPGPCAYVAHRGDRCSEGWRGRRGLAILRHVASRRRALFFKICTVSFCVPWLGSMPAKRVILHFSSRFCKVGGPVAVGFPCKGTQSALLLGPSQRSFGIYFFLPLAYLTVTFGGFIEVSPNPLEIYICACKVSINCV